MIKKQVYLHVRFFKSYQSFINMYAKKLKNQGFFKTSQITGFLATLAYAIEFNFWLELQKKILAV